jgi:hypothetical protein
VPCTGVSVTLHCLIVEWRVVHQRRAGELVVGEYDAEARERRADVRDRLSPRMTVHPFFFDVE